MRANRKYLYTRPGMRYKIYYYNKRWVPWKKVTRSWGVRVCVVFTRNRCSPKNNKRGATLNHGGRQLYNSLLKGSEVALLFCHYRAGDEKYSLFFSISNIYLAFIFALNLVVADLENTETSQFLWEKYVFESALQNLNYSSLKWNIYVTYPNEQIV